MPQGRPFSAHFLWPWLLAPGIVVVFFILVAIQVRLGLAGFPGRLAAVAMPAAVAVLLTRPRIRNALVIPWGPVLFPYNARILFFGSLHTIIRWAGAGFVCVGLCLAAAAFFAPTILLSISTMTTDPSPVPLAGVMVVVFLISVWQWRNGPPPENREFQRGTSMRNADDAKDAAEERMKQWENSDAP